MDTFLDFFWFLLWLFLWVIWIMLLFRVFADVFRSDHSGWAKAGWTVFVIVLPFLGVLVYLIAEGSNMAQREAQREYLRSVAASGGMPDQLEKLASLHERGVINDAEFEAQKAKLLA